MAYRAGQWLGDVVIIVEGVFQDCRNLLRCRTPTERVLDPPDSPAVQETAGQRHKPKVLLRSRRKDEEEHEFNGYVVQGVELNTGAGTAKGEDGLGNGV